MAIDATQLFLNKRAENNQGKAIEHIQKLSDKIKEQRLELEKTHAILFPNLELAEAFIAGLITSMELGFQFLDFDLILLNDEGDGSRLSFSWKDHLKNGYENIEEIYGYDLHMANNQDITVFNVNTVEKEGLSVGKILENIELEDFSYAHAIVPFIQGIEFLSEKPDLLIDGVRCDKEYISFNTYHGKTMAHVWCDVAKLKQAVNNTQEIATEEDSK